MNVNTCKELTSTLLDTLSHINKVSPEQHDYIMSRILTALKSTEIVRTQISHTHHNYSPHLLSSFLARNYDVAELILSYIDTRSLSMLLRTSSRLAHRTSPVPLDCMRRSTTSTPSAARRFSSTTSAWPSGPASTWPRSTASGFLARRKAARGW